MFNGNFINDLDPNMLDLSGGGIYTKISLDPTKTNFISSNFQDYLQNGVLSSSNNVLTLNTSNSSSYIDITPYKGIILNSFFFKSTTELFEISPRDIYNINNGIANLNQIQAELASQNAKINAIYGTAGSSSGYNLTDLENNITQLTSGSMTIDGTKNFTSSPTIPLPSGNTDAANKQYVDDNFIDKSTSQSINGVKSFNSPPNVPLPVNNSDVANKKYVDDKFSSINIPSGSSNIADPMPEFQNLYLQSLGNNIVEPLCIGIFETTSYKLEVYLGTSPTEVKFMFSGRDTFGIFPELKTKCDPNCTGYMYAANSSPLIKDSNFIDVIAPYSDIASIPSSDIKLLTTLKIANKNFIYQNIDVSIDTSGTIKSGLTFKTGNTTQYADYKRRKLTSSLKTDINYFDVINMAGFDYTARNLINFEIPGDQCYANLFVKINKSKKSLDFSYLQPCKKCSNYIEKQQIDIIQKVNYFYDQSYGFINNGNYIGRPIYFPYSTYISKNNARQEFVYIYPKGNSLILSMTIITPSDFTNNSGSYSFTSCFAVYGELEYYMPKIYRIDFIIDNNDLNPLFMQKVNFQVQSYGYTFDAIPFIIPFEVQDTVILMYVLITKDNTMYFIPTSNTVTKSLYTKEKTTSSNYTVNNNWNFIFQDANLDLIYQRSCLFKCNTVLTLFRDINWSAIPLYMSKSLLSAVDGTFNNQVYLLSHPNQYTMGMFYYLNNIIELYGVFKNILFDMSSTGLENITINMNTCVPKSISSIYNTYLFNNNVIINSISNIPNYWSYLYCPSPSVIITDLTSIDSFGMNKNYFAAMKSSSNSACTWPYIEKQNNLSSVYVSYIQNNESLLKMYQKPIDNYFVVAQLANRNVGGNTTYPMDQYFTDFYSSNIINVLFPNFSDLVSINDKFSGVSLTNYFTQITSFLIIEDRNVNVYIYSYINIVCFLEPQYGASLTSYPSITLPICCRFKVPFKSIPDNLTYIETPNITYPMVGFSQTSNGVYLITQNTGEIFVFNSWVPMPLEIYDFISNRATFVDEYKSQILEGVPQSKINESDFDYTLMAKCYAIGSSVMPASLDDAYHHLSNVKKIVDDKLFISLSNNNSGKIMKLNERQALIVNLERYTENHAFIGRNIFITPITPLNYILADIIPNTFPFYKLITDFKYNDEICFIRKLIAFPINSFPGDVYIHELSFIVTNINNPYIFNPYEYKTIVDTTITYINLQPSVNNLNVYNFSLNNDRLSFTLPDLSSVVLNVFNFGK